MTVRPAAFFSVGSDGLEPLEDRRVDGCGIGIWMDGVDEVFEERRAGGLGLWLRESRLRGLLQLAVNCPWAKPVIPHPPALLPRLLLHAVACPPVSIGLSLGAAEWSRRVGASEVAKASRWRRELRSLETTLGGSAEPLRRLNSALTSLPGLRKRLRAHLQRHSQQQRPADLLAGPRMVACENGEFAPCKPGRS